MPVVSLLSDYPHPLSDVKSVGIYIDRESVHSPVVGQVFLAPPVSPLSLFRNVRHDISEVVRLILPLSCRCIDF